MFRFRTIRKKQNEIDIDAAKELLLSGRCGVLAVNGDDGYFLFDFFKNNKYNSL